MKEYIIATNNKHKVEEIQQALGKNIKLITLKELGLKEDIPETANTLQGNALQKAKFIYDRFQKPCFADDTGLEVEALDGRPGVFSARYAGEGCSFDDNIDKLLDEMEGKTNRKASFKTVICLLEDGKELFFEEKCEGVILTERYGKGGFGYDPIFMPKGYGESFAEMSLEEKNNISHRAKAVKKLIEHINSK